MNATAVKHYNQALTSLQANRSRLEAMQFALGLTEAQLQDLLYYAQAVEFWSRELDCWARELETAGGESGSS